MGISPEDMLGVFARAEELADLVRRGRAHAEDLIEENVALRERVERLERTAPVADADVPEELGRLRAENDRLRSEVSEIDAEQRRFARRCVEAESQNEALANLYVATSQLHASLDCASVRRAIEDIVVGLVGAESWALFERVGDGDEFVRTAGGEPERAEPEAVAPERRFALGEGIEGEAAASGQMFVGEPGTAQEQTACLALMSDGECFGLVAIYSMLSHKPGGFRALDHELLHLLAAQAAPALVSSRLRAEKVGPMQAI